MLSDKEVSYFLFFTVLTGVVVFFFDAQIFPFFYLHYIPEVIGIYYIGRVSSRNGKTKRMLYLVYVIWFIILLTNVAILQFELVFTFRILMYHIVPLALFIGAFLVGAYTVKHEIKHHY